jgi:microcystin-dependent protein
MSEPFVGEIKMFAGNFAPRGWALCDGQLLAISQHDALFSLLGTIYGGDGRTTFALPDLRGRAPMHFGHGPGLTSRTLGTRGGVEAVTLTDAQMPTHEHNVANFRASGNPADTVDPAGNSLGLADVYSLATPDVALSAGSVSADPNTGATGGNQGHSNMPPYLAVNFIIALFGVYPSRS